MQGVALHGDFETRSTVNLKKAGVYRYAIHPTTGIWMLSWRFNDWPIQQWRPGEPFPLELIEHVAKGGRFIAHNAAFERTIWNYTLSRYVPGLPKMTIWQQSCTMARAYAVALPGPLEMVGPIVMPGLEKDMEGHALMKRMMKPRKVLPDGTLIWWDEPDRIERLGLYCDRDVEVETGVDTRLPELTAREREVWELDQTINERGIRVDRQLVTRAIELTGVAQRDANRRMKEITGGEVPSVSQVGKIVSFLQGRGVPCTSMKKGGHEELILTADLLGDPIAKQVVMLRRDGYKSSTAKLPAMLHCASEIDDLMRHLLAYHATTTGRWAGRLVQPQNFPRVDPDRDLPTVMAIIELLLSREPIEMVFEILSALFGEVMPWIAKLLRACLIAREGKDLIGGDLSNIEGRVNAWLAGEQWKLDAFRAYDEGRGPDMYKVAFHRSFGKPIEEINKTERQLGKVQELAAGYQGSIGAYLNMVDTYQMDLFALVGPVREATPARQWDLIGSQYRKTSSFGLTTDCWTAIKILVNNWRSGNPAITQSWWDRQDAAIDAVMNPHVLFPILGGKVAYMSTGNVLLCRLPSGRVLQYWNPRIVKQPDQIEVLDEDGNVIDIIDETEAEDLASIGIIVREGERRHGKRVVQYDGIDRKTKKWGVRYLYGGLQCENDVSGTARDVLVEAMFRLELVGYPIVLTVHDEIVSEVDEGFGHEDEFAALLAKNPEWLPGCPLAAAGWRDKRYVK